MSDQVLLALIALSGGLVTGLIWVVKRVFTVVEANTRVNDQVSSILQQISKELEEHISITEPTIRTQSEVVKTLHEIVKTQKEILNLIKNKKRYALSS